MQQHTATAPVFSEVTRLHTCNRIYSSILSTMMAAGRNEMTAQKYAQNIEVCLKSLLMHCTLTVVGPFVMLELRQAEYIHWCQLRNIW